MSSMEKLKYGSEELGLHLNTGQLEQFEIYYKELIVWNRKMNLTSITDYEEVQVKHFLDSLTVTLAMRAPFKSVNAIDIGTGAGLPGVPLKIIKPDISLVLLEATGKKARFLNHLVTALALEDVEIAVGRAEEVAHDIQYRENFDIVLSRAVASLPTLVELTLPFCAVGGSLIAQKKGDIQKEVEQSNEAINKMGGYLREIKPVGLEALNDSRYLIVIDKVNPTPEKYPRRPGIPAKRPIIS